MGFALDNNGLAVNIVEPRDTLFAGNANPRTLWLINEARDRELSELYLALACDANTKEAEDTFLNHASEYANLAVACKLMSLLV